jgi:hypothetical protein
LRSELHEVSFAAHDRAKEHAGLGAHAHIADEPRAWRDEGV